MPTEAEIEKRIDRDLAIAEAKYLGKLVRGGSPTFPLVGIVTHVGVYGRDVERGMGVPHSDCGRIILKLDGGTWRWLIPTGDTSSKWEVYDG